MISRPTLAGSMTHRVSFRPLRRFALLVLVASLLWAARPALAFERIRYESWPACEGRRVEEVVILGNERTHEVVLRREMRITEGVSFRSEDLWRDWERIVDLGLFAHVEVEALPSGDAGALVVISVFERPWWFVAPILDYDIAERDFRVGFRMRVRNFRGMNHQFRGKGIFHSGDHVSLSWFTPWIGRRRQPLSVGLHVDLPTQEDEDLRTSNLSVATTFYLGDFKKVRTGVTPFGRVDVLRRVGTDLVAAVHETSPVLGVGLARDSRDVRIDPTRGSVFSASSEFVTSTTTSRLSYLRSSLDARAFLHLGAGVVAAGRTRAVLSTGEIPEYRRISIGGPSSLRGQPEGVVAGKNLGQASFELRFPLLANRRFALPIPFVPKRISNFDLRIDGAVFLDAGTAWDDGVGLRKAALREGVGAGLRIFLPVVELARLEIAFDESGSPTLSLQQGNLI